MRFSRFERSVHMNGIYQANVQPRSLCAQTSTISDRSKQTKRSYTIVATALVLGLLFSLPHSPYLVGIIGIKRKINKEKERKSEKLRSIEWDLKGEREIRKGKKECKGKDVKQENERKKKQNATHTNILTLTLWAMIIHIYVYFESNEINKKKTQTHIHTHTERERSSERETNIR